MPPLPPITLLLLAALAFACDDTQVNYATTEANNADASDADAPTDAATSDTATSDTTTSDTATPDTSAPDTAQPSGSCYNGPCVPTLRYLTWGPTCADDSACPEGLSCLPCQASNDCQSKDCRPACGVPYAPHAPVSEPLRLDGEVEVPAGEVAEVTVQGTSFYVGALGHRFRYRDAEVFSMSGAECSAQLTLPAADAGLHPVWVSQYSGGEPWVLAGFVRVGATAACVQPGLPCSDEGAACCETPDVPMVCQDGRCRRP